MRGLHKALDAKGIAAAQESGALRLVNGLR